MSADRIWEKIKKGVFIIAEAGKNFIQTEEERPVEEYLKNAKELVDKAVWAGADAIKWQTHNVEDEQLNIEIVSPHFKGAARYAWVMRNTKATPPNAFWRPLKEYCDKKGIVFFSTPMSRGAAKILNELGVELWKIGSGDILDFVAMDFMRNTGKPIIMSSGMSTLEEVETGLKFLLEKNKRVSLVHALSKYPGLPEEANLATMHLYQERFPGVPVGFSENSVGIEPACLAVVLGATIIEKHFTISRDLWGADHKVSSTPEEFKRMTDAVREMEEDSEIRDKWLEWPTLKEVLGKKEKILKDDEALFRPIFRKSLMAGQDIPLGTTLTAEMIYAMRPQIYAKGLPSEHYPKVIGRKAKKYLKKFEPITFDVLE